MSGKRESYKKLSTTNATIIIAVLIGLCFIGLLISQFFYLGQSEKYRQSQHYSLLKLSVALTDGYIGQAVKLSQMMMLDPDVSKFIYQGTITEGSSEIQTLIDALYQIPKSKSVNPFLSDLFIYSKTSDYLMNSNNAFFEIDRMYSLFAFDGLSSWQWRTTYLGRGSGFFRATGAMVNGQHVRVIPYVETYPISKPSANNGKIILLLDEAFILKQMKTLVKNEGSWFCITDEYYNVITGSREDIDTTPSGTWKMGSTRIFPLTEIVSGFSRSPALIPTSTTSVRWTRSSSGLKTNFSG